MKGRHTLKAFIIAALAIMATVLVMNYCPKDSGQPPITEAVVDQTLNIDTDTGGDYLEVLKVTLQPSGAYLNQTAIRLYSNDSTTGLVEFYTFTELHKAGDTIVWDMPPENSDSTHLPLAMLGVPIFFALCNKNLFITSGALAFKKDKRYAIFGDKSRPETWSATNEILFTDHMHYLRGWIDYFTRLPKRRTGKKNSYLCIDNLCSYYTLDKIYTSVSRDCDGDDIIIVDDGDEECINIYKWGADTRYFKLIEPNEPIKRISPVLNGVIVENFHKMKAVQQLKNAVTGIGLAEAKECVDNYGINVNKIINLINDGVIKRRYA
jgi:hypothetical protein